LQERDAQIAALLEQAQARQTEMQHLQQLLAKSENLGSEMEARENALGQRLFLAERKAKALVM
jgi:hypothetical protein